MLFYVLTKNSTSVYPYLSVFSAALASPPPSVKQNKEAVSLHFGRVWFTDLRQVRSEQQLNTEQVALT